MPNKGTALLREKNEKRTLAFLRINKNSSRLEIAKALDLSKNTISLIIDKFIKEGVVKELGIKNRGGVGRPSVRLAIAPEVYKSMGISVQGTQAQYVITDYFANLIEKGEISLDSKVAEECIPQLVKLCRNLLAKHPEVLGIGIGIPGLVDPKYGIVHYSSHLGWKDVPLKESLEKEISVPIRILNSVKAAALAPIQDRLQDDYSSNFYIRIDKGIGGALIIANDIYHGTSWSAGEVGHLKVEMNGPLCTCGQRGCLESLVSVPKIMGSLWDRCQFEKLEPLLINNNQIANEIFHQAGVYLGLAISQIINLLNPQFIMVDSPFDQIEAFKRATIKTAEEQSLNFPFQQSNILFIRTRFSSAQGAAQTVILDFENESQII